MGSVIRESIGRVTHDDIAGMVMAAVPEFGDDGVTLVAGLTRLAFTWDEWDRLTTAAGLYLKCLPSPDRPFLEDAPTVDAVPFGVPRDGFGVVPEAA